MPKTILIVDDHLSVRRMLADYLGEQGYRIASAADGDEALRVARQVRPDVILLDVMMPNRDGFAVIQAYRREASTPIILLTARIEESDKVIGLELGADDYVTKPFSLKELHARIRAVLRRAETRTQADDERYRVGDLLVSRTMRSVLLADQPISLTPSEFELLALMIAAPGRVFSREQLLEHLQGNNYEGAERTIDVHIRNLRRKLEPDPAHPRYIETVFGIGYRCRAEQGS